MHLPPPPDPRQLLPPLLACLPTSFVSARPPPALLPLLSPVLRQRLNYLSGSGSTHRSSDGWLPLLSWDAARGAQLPAVVEQMDLEPHPVSGELELHDLPPPQYRRLDAETLHARLVVEQFGLCPIYLWCEHDEHAGAAAPGGWKLAELRSLKDGDDNGEDEEGEEWFASVSAANDAAADRALAPGGTNGGRDVRPPQARRADEADDEDDDYWASYDRTPGRTPAPTLPHSPYAERSPPPSAGAGSEMAYYARYGAEVQPAMDAHDPDEPPVGESSLNGEALRPSRGSDAPSTHMKESRSRSVLSPDGDEIVLPLDDPSVDLAPPRHPSLPGEALSMPRPRSHGSQSSSVDHLEAHAAAMDSEPADRAVFGIKQHISTDIKSLFRLARSAGMERSEFERIVRTELEVLSLLEEDGQ